MIMMSYNFLLVLMYSIACQSVQLQKYEISSKLAKDFTLKYLCHLHGGSDETDSFEDRALSDEPEPDFMLGKDRELFHLSFNFKWIWNTIFNREKLGTFVNGFLGESMKCFNRVFKGFGAAKYVFNVQAHAKEISVDILSDIRNSYKGSVIKFFGGTFPQAQLYSIKRNRLLLVYVEDKKGAATNDAFRRALADPNVGTLVNEQFVFFGSSLEHASTRKIVRALGARTFPYFAVLFVSGPLFKDIEVLAVLPPSADMKSDKLAKFLTRAQELHGGKLLVSKRERDRVEAELALILQQKKERESVLKAARASAEDEARLVELQRLENERKKGEEKKRSDILRALPSEPPVGETGSVAIALRLSAVNNTRQERRFRPTDSAEVLFQWATGLGVDFSVQELSTLSPPKRIFDTSEALSKKTIADLQIPSSLLLVAQRKKTSTNANASPGSIPTAPTNE